MSRSTLSTLQYEIRGEIKFADNAEADLKSLEKSIYNAMDDKVGYRARESLAGIRNQLSLNINDGLRSAEKAANALEAGYSKTENLSAQGNQLLQKAKNVLAELGDI